jgi:ATP-dependent Lon protease
VSRFGPASARKAGEISETECGLALIVAIISAIKRVSVQPALVIVGDISIQGNLKGVRTLVEPCQLAMENGARRALIPIENRRQFLERRR